MKKIHSTLRYRPNSRAWLAALLLCLSPVVVSAQDAVGPVLTIDQDRLFSETRLGAEALAELEREAQLLAAENARIEGSLIAEERSLTEQRAVLDTEAFRVLADEFDARVQQFRAEQDEKARQLNRRRDEARAAFFNEVAVILSDIVSEKGAVIVIDRRDVFLSADRIDITDEAIERVNEVGSIPE